MKEVLETIAENKGNVNGLAIFSLFVVLTLCQITYAERQVSQFGITWKFNRDYTIGQFANSDYWVLGPVTIIGIDPPSTEANGRTINGSMVNPSPKLGSTQGYDSAMYGGYGSRFDPNLNVGRPNNRDLSARNYFVLQPHSSLVSTISISEGGHRPQLSTAAILTVLSEPAAEGSFRPPYCGADKTIKFNKNQLDYSWLANLKPVPGAPGIMVVERYFERPWIDHIPGWMGCFHHPLENMPWYDRDVCNRVGIGALKLHLNLTNQMKEVLLIRYVQLGIDLYGIVQDGGKSNWLQTSGRKYPILFAGLVLNNSDMKNIGAVDDPADPNHIRFEEDETTFYITKADVDMTHSSRWNPDSRTAMLLPYEEQDIGLPEWGIVRGGDITRINKHWGAIYRTVIGQAYGGFILAMHIMGVKDLWNHDALFDYKDRYMQVESNYRELSKFVEKMWDAYRADYGPVWTMYPMLNIIATGGSVTKTPDKTLYTLGEKVVLSAFADPGYEFAGWSGCLSGMENPVTIVMHANRSIIANFTTIALAPENVE